MDIGKAVGDVFMGDPEQDAIALLKTDHRKVEKLFKDFAEAEGPEAEEMLETIILELALHTAIEEDLLYPALEDKIKDMIDESYEEHHLVKLAIAELADISADAPTCKAKVLVLSELVDHHVKEEEDDIFPELKKSGIDLQELAQQMTARKEQLKEKIQQVGKKEGRQRSVPPDAGTTITSEFNKLKKRAS